jgi:hypothetical protein
MGERKVTDVTVNLTTSFHDIPERFSRSPGTSTLSYGLGPT